MKTWIVFKKPGGVLVTYGIIKVNKTVPVVHRLDWVKLVDYVKRYISINENIRFCDNGWVKKLDLSKRGIQNQGKFLCGMS